MIQPMILIHAQLTYFWFKMMPCFKVMLTAYIKWSSRHGAHLDTGISKEMHHFNFLKIGNISIQKEKFKSFPQLISPCLFSRRKVEKWERQGYMTTRNVLEREMDIIIPRTFHIHLKIRYICMKMEIAKHSPKDGKGNKQVKIQSDSHKLAHTNYFMATQNRT